MASAAGTVGAQPEENASSCDAIASSPTSAVHPVIGPRTANAIATCKTFRKFELDMDSSTGVSNQRPIQFTANDVHAKDDAYRRSRFLRRLDPYVRSVISSQHRWRRSYCHARELLHAHGRSRRKISLFSADQPSTGPVGVCRRLPLG